MTISVKMDICQEAGECSVGEIFGNKKVHQKFRCNHDNLCKVDLKFATYARVNLGVIRITLSEKLEGATLFSKDIPCGDIADNSWLSFVFNPIENSKGKDYVIKVEGINCRVGSSTTVYYSPSAVDAGQFYINKTKFKGSLAFKTFYKIENIAAFKRETKINKRKRVVLLACYFEKDRMDKHQEYTIKSLKKISDTIILFSDSSLNLADSKKIKPYLTYSEYVRHESYDFGSWKRAFFYAKENGYLADCEEILFCNDSVIGPVGDIADFFETKEMRGSPHFFGITINSFGYKDINSLGNAVYSPHIQSYFFTISKEIFNTKFFENFLRNIKKEDHKLKYVINYEMGLSRLIQENGYPLECMYESSSSRPHNPPALEALSVLDKALFIKKSMLPKLNLNKINEIFKIKKYPYMLPSALVKPKNPIYLASVTEYEAYFLFYIVSDSENTGLTMSLTNTSKQSFLKPTRNVNEICKGLEKHYNLLNKHSYFFKVPSKEIPSCISFNAPLKSILGNILPHNTLKKYFPVIRENQLILSTSKEKFLESIPSLRCSVEDMNILNIIYKIKDKELRYNLFADKENLRGDSAYQLFKYSNSPEDYYLVNKRHPEDAPNIIERHSKEHLRVFLYSKNIITSFYYKALIPRQLKDVHLSLLNHKFIYIPHGVTAGHNNSFEVSALGGTTPDKIVCGSDYEFNNFKKLGHKDVVVTGYPRCDKWSEVPLKDQVVLFFTWRKYLHNSSTSQFINSNYIETISSIISSIDKPIYLFPHNSISSDKVKALKDKFKGKVKFVMNEDTVKFNQILNESKYLITDISSVGYDFAYKNRRALFFIEKKFIEGHYIPTPLFRETCGGILTDKMEDIAKYLRNESLASQSGVFFKYRDANNCERALEVLGKNP